MGAKFGVEFWVGESIKRGNKSKIKEIIKIKKDKQNKEKTR